MATPFTHTPPRDPARPVRAAGSRKPWAQALLTTAVATACWTAVPQAHAAEWQVSAAHGNRAGVKKVGFGVVWDPHAPLWQGQVWQLRLRHEIQFAYWDVPHAQDIVEAGYSPFLRLQYGNATPGNWVPFVEASVGVRLISHPRLSEQITMSTAFQFADTLGAGVQFGNRAGSTVGIRFQHLSNASIKTPNPGINFTLLYYQQSF